MSSTELPFNYIIRESTRAKQLQLRITERHGLEVVVPKRLKNDVDITSLLHKKREWVQKHLQTLAASESSQSLSPLPQEIMLKSLQENWSIRYLENPRWQLLENPLRELTVLGNINDSTRCQALLVQWLKQKAHNHLAPLLQQLSFTAKLPFRHLTIRGQQTRWGSCSVQKDISLNYQLLFLPPPLVKHILLHELVHTVHMNHGVRFWRLLMKLDSETKQHAYEARRARVHVPRWAHAERVSMKAEMEKENLQTVPHGWGT